MSRHEMIHKTKYCSHNIATLAKKLIYIYISNNARIIQKYIAFFFWGFFLFCFFCFVFWWEGGSFFLLFFKEKLLKSLLTTAIVFFAIKRAQIPLPFLWLHVYETSVIVISSSSDGSHCQFYGLCTSGAADVRQELGQEVNHHYVILRQE